MLKLVDNTSFPIFVYCRFDNDSALNKTEIPFVEIIPE